MAEHLAHPDEVEHPAVVHDLDRAGSYHPEHARLGALGEDLRPGEMELDLGRGGGPLDLRPAEGVEGRVGEEELDDLRDGAHWRQCASDFDPTASVPARTGPTTLQAAHRNPALDLPLARCFNGSHRMTARAVTVEGGLDVGQTKVLFRHQAGWMRT